MLSSLAARAAVPVFPAIGEGGLAEVERLRLSSGLRLVASPRDAAILLVAGALPEMLIPDLRRLHDQLPHPRATVLWNTGELPGLDAGEKLPPGPDPSSAIAAVWSGLLDGTRASEPDLLPDQPPNPWRGVGPHGQGGKGMMGGVPYGRAMAMTAADGRDGLTLDAYTARFGPFLPMFPPGLALTLTLQGDVIQKTGIAHPPFAAPSDPSASAARLLRLLDLPGTAERMLRGGAPGGLTRWSLNRAIPPGLGRLPGGTDVAARLDRWLDGAEANEPDANLTLDDLLAGLEWQEAMLVLNSFEPTDLVRICGAATAPGMPMAMDAPADPHAGHGA